MHLSIVEQGVQTLMKSELLCLDINDSVSRCVSEMEDIEWQPALVLKDEIIVGIVTWRHFIALLASGMTLSEVQTMAVGDIMEVEPTTIDHRSTPQEAIALFYNSNTDYIVVTDEERPIGLITDDTISHRAYPLFEQRIARPQLSAEVA